MGHGRSRGKSWSAPGHPCGARGVGMIHSYRHQRLSGIAMAAIEKRTFSLPAEQAAFIDAQVASGAFASASEVVRAGLRALQERDAAVERWLREEVAATYDEVKAHPERTISGDRLLESVRRLHTARVKRG